MLSLAECYIVTGGEMCVCRGIVLLNTFVDERFIPTDHYNFFAMFAEAICKILCH